MRNASFSLSKRIVIGTTEPVLMGFPDGGAQGDGTLVCSGVDSTVGLDQDTLGRVKPASHTYWSAAVFVPIWPRVLTQWESELKAPTSESPGGVN